MIPIKVLCSCGQKFSFDVEPINGRMPSAVACPSCGLDATPAANSQIRAQTLRPTAPAPASAPKKSNTLAVVIVCASIFVLLGLAGGAFIWLKLRGRSSSDFVPYPTAVAPAEKETVKAAPPAKPAPTRDPSFVAVGAMFDRNLKTHHVEITRVLTNSPAQKAGIVAGDILLKVNDEWIEDLRLKETVEMVFGPVGSKITMDLIHPATGATNRVEMIREKYHR